MLLIDRAQKKYENFCIIYGESPQKKIMPLIAESIICLYLLIICMKFENFGSLYALLWQLQQKIFHNSLFVLKNSIPCIDLPEKTSFRFGWRALNNGK